MIFWIINTDTAKQLAGDIIKFYQEYEFFDYYGYRYLDESTEAYDKRMLSEYEDSLKSPDFAEKIRRKMLDYGKEDAGDSPFAQNRINESQKLARRLMCFIHSLKI